MIKDDGFTSRKWLSLMTCLVLVGAFGGAVVVGKTTLPVLATVANACVLLYGIYCGAHVGEKVGGSAVGGWLQGRRETNNAGGEEDI